MEKVITFFVAVCVFNLADAQILPATQPGCYPFPKTISVTGSAEMDIIPDEINVQVDLIEYKKKGEEKIELSKIQSEFLANCKALGIPDSNISVASYNGFNPAIIWRKRKKDPELMSSITYQIRFRNTKLMDELINRLDDEATTNFFITRTSHSKISEYRKQLKILAVKSAKEKAFYLAESVNEQLGQAITIVEPVESVSSDVVSGKLKGYSNSSMKENKISAFEDEDSGIDYKKIKLRFEVKVLYSLK